MFISPDCFPILEVAVLVEASVLDDVADVGSDANARHDCALVKSSCELNLGCKLFFTESAGIKDIESRTVGQVFVCLFSLIEISVEEVGCSAIEVITTFTLCDESVNSGLEVYVGKMTAANKVRSTSPHVADCLDVFKR